MRPLRFAFRSLWLNKGFAFVAIACLSLGVGLNTTIFSVVDGVVIQSLPYFDADRIVTIGGRNDKADIDEAGVSYLDYVDIKAAQTSLGAMAGLSTRSMTISDGAGEPERVLGAMVTWDLFPLLGKQPVLGRPFAENDDRPGAAQVVMLSYSVWMNRYQGDRSVIGRGVLVNALPSEIIGVMPDEFEFPENQKLWTTLVPSQSTNPRQNRNLQVLGRLKPGVTEAQAQKDLSAVAGRLAQAYPAVN